MCHHRHQPDNDYRWRRPRPLSVTAMQVRDQMQRIAPEFPSYGYRRITAELRRRNWRVNHKRVLRIVPGDNLLSAPQVFPGYD